VTSDPASVSGWSGSNFRVGRVFDHTTSVYTRNFLPFSLVNLVASAPLVLFTVYAGGHSSLPALATGALVSTLTTLAAGIFGLLSQAILVSAAFQDLRGRPVNLLESVKVALRRFFPVLGLIVVAVLGLILFATCIVLVPAVVSFGTIRVSAVPSVFPAITFIVTFISLIAAVLALIVRWFVAVPICVVERFGPWKSLKRSSQLTKGHRWRVLGILLLVYVTSLIIGQIIAVTTNALGGRLVAIFASLLWNTIWGAVFAILVVVTYYELRAAKEGVDIDQVAAVFD